MTFQDIIITPIILGLLYLIAFIIRKRFSTHKTLPYFIPALTLKFIGAISLGLIYQFYYDGGDTFNFFNESKVINSAVLESPSIWLKLMLSDGSPNPDIYYYSSRLYWFSAPTEFMVSKITAIAGVFSMNTYSSTALIFAFLSFTGLWAMYESFVHQYPSLYKLFLVAIFIVPSVFFWGSGVMKDTITIGCLGWLFNGFYNLAVRKRKITSSIIIISICILLLYNIRVYMLLAFLPPAAFWVMMENNKKIKNPVIKYLSIPLFFIVGLLAGYYIIINVSAGDARYDINNIGTYVKINAEYLYRHSIAQGGSAYYLGDLDGTLWGSIKLAPQAIWVTLFRPYLWEVNNVVMLLSSLESTVIFFLTLYVIVIAGPRKIISITVRNPLVLFSLVFSLIFALAVGITSYNFGTLVRYKIPIIPFYLSALFIIKHYAKAKI